MKKEIKYISKNDYYSSDDYKLKNRHIEVCLYLLEKLMLHNKKCWNEVKEKLEIDSDIIDFRTEQFVYFHNTLMNIYYGCLSLNKAYDISTYMNYRGIDNDLNRTFESQRRYISFNAIIRLFDIFNACREEYENAIKNMPEAKGVSDYYDKLICIYGQKAEAIKILRSFRNATHSNGKVGKELTYKVGNEIITIKKGETFKYNHFFLYELLRNCIEVHTKLALANEPAKIRDLRYTINGQQAVAMRTENVDWDNIFK